MATAHWQGVCIAESDDVIEVEGNIYFPRESLNEDVIEASSTTTSCFWKGTAHYYSLNIDGQQNADAVWYYPDPKSKAAHIKDRVAFWKGVQVEGDGPQMLPPDGAVC